MTQDNTTQAAADAHLLSTVDMTVRYDHAHEALHPTSLGFDAGTCTALIGPSGCGKSTFLRCINLMNREIPHCDVGGSILYHGHDINNPRENLFELRKSIAPRRHGRVAGRDEADALVEESLRQAALWDEVKDKLDRSAHALSGGQQQRLCIARTLAMKPDVVLFDEPCSALDPISTFAVEETIRQIADSGISCVIVTHNMEQAKRVSDRTAFFYMGDMVETGTTRQVFLDPQDQRLVDYLTGRFG